MPVSFGSVGDIIAVGLLIKDLVKCLDDSRGSSSEFQSVIRELHSLDRALLEVGLLCSSYEASLGLDAHLKTALDIAEQCKSCVTEFQKRAHKYKPSLQPGGSGTILRDTAIKLKWSLSEKEQLPKFRAEIMAHCLSLNTILALASV